MVYFLGTWLIPANKIGGFGLVFGASGNDATCSMSGFFTQLAISSPLYNGTLCWYYLLTIYYNWKETKIRKVEKWFHIIPIAFAVTTAIMAAAFQMYGNVEWLCWINPDVPQGDKSDAQKHFVLFQWLFLFGPLWVTIFFVTVVMFLLWNKMKENELKMSKYKFSIKSSRPDMIKRDGIHRKSDGSINSLKNSMNSLTKSSFKERKSDGSINSLSKSSFVATGDKEDVEAQIGTAYELANGNGNVAEDDKPGFLQKMQMAEDDKPGFLQQDSEPFGSAGPIAKDATKLDTLEADSFDRPTSRRLGESFGSGGSSKEKLRTSAFKVDKVDSGSTFATSFRSDDALSLRASLPEVAEQKEIREGVLSIQESDVKISVNDELTLRKSNGENRVSESKKYASNNYYTRRVSFIGEAEDDTSEHAVDAATKGVEKIKNSEITGDIKQGFISRMSTSLSRMTFHRSRLSSNSLNDSSSINPSSDRRKKLYNKASQSRQIAIQGMLYVVAFYITWLFPTVQRITELAVHKNFFVFQFFDTFLLPLQGLFNFIIYIRPRVATCRKRNKDMGFWKAVWTVAIEIED